jgi:hypothetical protein
VFRAQIRSSGLQASALIAVGKGHRLLASEPQDMMLKECNPS